MKISKSVLQNLDVQLKNTIILKFENIIEPEKI